MTAETRWKRLIVKWTAPKGLAAITLFFVLTLVIEALQVYFFQAFGLVDRNIWTATFLIPYADWPFAVSISPLFHLLPLSVITVLLTSWAYLTKHIAFIPERVEATRRVSAPTRRVQESRRFKSLRQFYRRLNRRLQRVSRGLKAGVKRIRGVSYISQRLFFAHAAVRSAAIVFVVFISGVFIVVLAEYPDLIRNWTLNLYMGSPAFLNFVKGIGQWFGGVGQAVPPLGGLGSALNNALVWFAPGFRRSLEGAGASLIQPIVQLDLVGKYVLSQNLAAWTSALVALVYSAYAASRPRRRPKGR